MEFIRDEEKDSIVRNRLGGGGIGFEDVVWAFVNKKVILDGLNGASYIHQRMMIVEINGYPYKVPYIQVDSNTRKLVTVFPNRKFKSLL